MSGRARNWLVLCLEVALVFAFVIAFGVFLTQSDDFLVARHRERAIAAAATFVPELPATFDFGFEQPANDLLGAGWRRSMKRDEGRWTKSEAYAILPVPVGGTAISLDIDGSAYLAPGHETVFISLWLDGVEAGVWTARYGQPAPEIRLTAPASVASDGLIELRINAVPLAVPYHYEDTDDKRQIGFLLRRITVSAEAAD